MFKDERPACPVKGCRSRLNADDNRICRYCMIKFGIMPGFEIGDDLVRAMMLGKIGPADQRRRMAAQAAHKAFTSVVYFIQMGEGGPIKIGRTATSVETRIAELQTGNPYKLRAIAAIRAEIMLEQQFHSYFDEYRMEGEWFKPHPEVLAMAQLAAASDLNAILDLFEKRLAENG